MSTVKRAVRRLCCRQVWLCLILHHDWVNTYRAQSAFCLRCGKSMTLAEWMTR